MNEIIEHTERIITVKVSEDLVMPRADVFKSSLYAPSGAKLAWLELLEESLGDDENQ